ncbi:SPFH domain-containing protein [Clostridium sp. UBA1056]|uniref:SPFH domain-containing protein n=1 Tax=unclassified Clostridium TaxID=2614128 RepID=UPI0032177313
MGIMDFVKGQFIDVIEYVDESNKIIVNKYNRPNNEIKQGARAIVRESQAAIFLKGGELADILYSGTYSLNTDNLPILSALTAFGYGFNSPIKADLYFISLRQFIDNKWATKTPIIKRDNEFNMARIRSFGKYAFRIVDVEKFMKELFGTQGKVLTYDIIEYLSSLITESVVITIGETNMPILDLAIKYRELSSVVQKTANTKAAQMGIEFSNVVIESISLPDEVEQMIDEQSGIGMASKDMNTFMKYQTARAMRDASKQEGGLAGLGAGMALGNTMAGTISNATSFETNCKSSADQLRELKNLLDEGILTQEEFDAKKKQILGL